MQPQKRRIRIRNVVIRVLLLLVFGWVVIAVVENLVIPAMTNQFVIVENGNQVLTNVGLSFLISEEFEVPLDIQLVQSIRGEYSESAVRLVLTGIALSGEKLGDSAKQICLTRLWVTEPLPLPDNTILFQERANLVSILDPIVGEKKLSVEFDDLCVEPNKIKLRSAEDETTQVGVLPFATGLSPYFYPFDTRSLDLKIWVETEITYADDSTKVFITAPNVSTQYNLQDWQLSVYKEQTTPEDGSHPISSFQMLMKRAFASRLLTTTLLISLLIIIILLSFTKQIDAFIQASVAVLLTLLGIQDLLLPAEKIQTTIIDQAILILYILFALVVLSHLTIKPIWERTRISEPEDLDDRT
jgi:hypothetical protein